MKKMIMGIATMMMVFGTMTMNANNAVKNDKKKEEESQSSDNDYYGITSGPYTEYGDYDNEYYDEDINYNDYDEYDDNRYRAQYLNSSYYSQMTRRSLNQNRPRASLNSRNVHDWYVYVCCIRTLFASNVERVVLYSHEMVPLDNGSTWCRSVIPFSCIFIY